MTVKSLFLMAPAETAEAARGPAAFAIGLAREHGAELTIFCVSLDVTSPGERPHADQVANSLREAAEAAGVTCHLVTEHSHALGIHEVVTEHARQHDLVVTGVENEGLLSEQELAEHLLFEGGRPVLLVPADHDQPYAKGPIAVAWDDGRSAARALGDALALFGPVEGVLLTIDGEKELPGDLDAGARIAAAARRGFTARQQDAALGERDIGEALQAEAQAAGASLLVMGAEGHSRLRSFLLGSATVSVLDDLEMPALLAH